MELIPKWLKPARATSAVGIYLTAQCLVAVDEKNDSHIVQRNLIQGDAVDVVLRTFIDEQKWHNRRLHFALSRDWYQHHTIEKPAIPDDELGQALPWCMRDMLEDPVDSLLFDYFDLPLSPAGQQRIAVYSTPMAPLADIVKAVTPQSEIATISVDDVALANLFGPEERALLLYKMPGQELTMAFIHHQQWHFSRPIRGFQALDDEQMSAEHLIFDNLLLELQRSIDYAVGQLKLTPPERWYLALAPTVTPLLQDNINQVFNISAESLTSAMQPTIALPALGILRGDQQ